ncbi:Hypothetical predicted protein, partial [Paramuricea clavata]
NPIAYSQGCTRIHHLNQVIFTEKTCKKTGHPGNELRENLSSFTGEIKHGCVKTAVGSELSLVSGTYHENKNDNTESHKDGKQKVQLLYSLPIIFLYLVLHLKPFKPHDIIPDAHQSPFSPNTFDTAICKSQGRADRAETNKGYGGVAIYVREGLPFQFRKQFGFRPKYSTTTALSNFADEVLLNMEQGNLCGAVFLDLAKAFDTVDHCILLSKLSAIGVSPSSIKWFESYLSNRKQRTSCGNELSDALSVTVGVPQGSILGPLLFVVYINNLPDAVINSEVTLYADDTVLYYFSKDPRLLEDKLNEDLLRQSSTRSGRFDVLSCHLTHFIRQCTTLLRLSCDTFSVLAFLLRSSRTLLWNANLAGSLTGHSLQHTQNSNLQQLSHDCFKHLYRDCQFERILHTTLHRFCHFSTRLHHSLGLNKRLVRYSQTGSLRTLKINAGLADDNGVAMGTKMGPNHANLFVGFVEKQIFEQYTDPIPDYLEYPCINQCSFVFAASAVKTKIFRPKATTSTYKNIRETHSTTIVSAPKSEFHIKHHFTRCGMLYIGETGRCLRT